MSKQFDELSNFILNEMRMSHIYQPVMLIELLGRQGSASTTEIAKSLLRHDMTIEERKNTAIQKIREAKAAEKIGSAVSEHEKHLEEVSVNRFAEIREALTEIQKEMGSVALQKVSFGKSSATIDYHLGGPITVGKGRNRRSYQRTFIKFEYCFDASMGKFCCKTSYQTGVADWGKSFLMYLRVYFFGDPSLKVSTTYFDTADNLIDDFANRLMDGADKARGPVS